MLFSMVILAASSVHGVEQEDVELARQLCGRNNLAIVLAHLSGDFNQTQLDRLLADEGAPFSFSDLQNAADRLGYKTRLVHWRDIKGARFRCAAILHVRLPSSPNSPGHFVACLGESDKGLCIAEFPGHPYFLPREKLYKIWAGDVLYISTQEDSNMEYQIDGFYSRPACAIVGVTILALVLMILMRAKHARQTNRRSVAV